MTETFNISKTASQQLVANSVTKDFQDLVEAQGFKVPDWYHVANALQEAVATLPTVKGITSVSADSIKKTLFDMVVQGLSPAKTQVYFIAYGNQLQMQRSYFGTQQVLKRLKDIKDIQAYVVRKDEEFDVDYDENGGLIVKAHHTDFMKLDNEIVGAYAVITKADGEKQYEVMTKKQIDTSWGQARSTNVHKKFPEEMAKRTVINRAAKNIINTSGDDDNLIAAINSTTANENNYDDEPKDVTPAPKQNALSRMAKVAVKEPEKVKPEPVEEVSEPEPEPAEKQNVISGAELPFNDETAQVEEFPEEPVKSALEQVNSENTVVEIKRWLDQHHMLYQQSATKAQLLERVADYLNEQETNPDEEIDMGDTPYQPDEFWG
ncbi:recombinase RecT [Weissella paramesenteroides]|uniref:RecT family recombinase n=1 Tax=Weissella paramesenteroides TaxID=1249 RepID=UPI001238F364|nr:RecT family recombinase [Weissella paramesenteroides]KAA8440453.1 recombinase RecT [Weissella paramesenteroides]KAA8440956.1 recombinase RecT [Weissella paramesenteroides]KAA8443387.1 recombinase RecT [Weissella paramesenteroides]KAA8447676.1 recombinase RecT [Weissella paramesenteroides]KAA8449721.1 recombinase RecT [Weissella paramesenteroides]